MDHPDLTALGFDFPAWSDLMAALDPTKLRGYENRLGFRFVGAYTDPSGARLLLTYSDAAGTQTSSDLVSDVTVAAGVTPIDGPSVRLDVLGDAEDSGSIVTTYLAMLDDAFVLPGPVIVRDLKVGGVALAARIYASPGEFGESTDSYLDPSERGNAVPEETTASRWTDSAPLRVALPFLVSYGLIKAVADRGAASPVSRLTGTITSAERRTNDLTGQAWWYVRVDSVLPLALGVPDGDVRPTVGGVVAGDFWMVASTGTWDL